MEECCICLENENCVEFYDCKHVFHEDCLNKLKQFKFNRCPICKCKNSGIKQQKTFTNKITFNNMTNREFNLNKYLCKWEKKDCIEKNHSFLVETLGDWYSNHNSDEIVSFSYKFMYIQCEECGINKFIK